MRQSRSLLLLILLLAVRLQSFAQTTKPISASEAKDHVGEKTTVCGRIVASHYASPSVGGRTFLNFDKPYPNQTFTIVIWDTDRLKFGNPEESYRNKTVCVSGRITSSKGKPEIIARSPTQITIK
jgi:hypothetical protein